MHIPEDNSIWAFYGAILFHRLARDRAANSDCSAAQDWHHNDVEVWRTLAATRNTPPPDCTRLKHDTELRNPP